MLVYFSFQEHFISHLLSTLRIQHNKKKFNKRDLKAEHQEKGNKFYNLI